MALSLSLVYYHLQEEGLNSIDLPLSVIRPFRPNRFDHYFYALTVEKQQIYKLTSRHRVPRCELVDLLFLSTLEAMERADRTLLMSINKVIFIQVTDAKMRGSVISVYKYFPL